LSKIVQEIEIYFSSALNSNLEEKTRKRRIGEQWTTAGIICKSVVSNTSICFLPLPQAYFYNIVFSNWDIYGRGSDFSATITQRAVFGDGVMVSLTPDTYNGELLQAIVTLQSYNSN
jgi:hypothetical protein